MKDTVLLVTLSAEMLTTLVLAVGFILPRQRIWPPGPAHTRGGVAMIILFLLSGVGVISLGILDWSNFCVPRWLRIIVGMPLWMAGSSLAVWAISMLGIAPGAGTEAALTCRGPDSFSINPQYPGYMLALAGRSLMTNSALVMIISLGGMIPLLLVLLAEEAWLLERHAEQNADYRRRVPRFIGFIKEN